MLGMLIVLAIFLALVALGVFLAEMRDRPMRRAMDAAAASASRSAGA